MSAQPSPVPALADLRRRTGTKWSRYGPEVLPAWIADMDFPPAPAIRRGLLAAMDRGDLGYPDFDGWGGVPELFTERMAGRYGWSVDPGRVLVVGDVVQSIYLAIATCSEPGDGVVVHTPVYPPFLQAVAESGRRLVEAPLARGPLRYQLDPGAPGGDALEGSRLLLLCNPHNPTGRVLERGELEQVAALAVDHDLVVVSDEIHADLTWEGHTHIPFATLGPEVAERTITLYSATKAFNIAGLRCSVAHLGSQALLERFSSVPHHMRGGVGSLALAATAAAWRDGEEWLEATRARLESNRRMLGELLAELLPAAGYIPPEATYLAWLDCRGLGLGDDPWRHFMEKAGVALSDGSAFGEPGRGHVRLNFATTPELLTQVVERLAASVGPPAPG